MAGPPGAPGGVVPPNQTLYITSLPSAKIQKDDLRTALYMLFSTYGPVLDVVAMKTMKMRGQAHVVYRDVQTATQAMRALNGSQFLGNEIKIEYAKSKSDIISKLDGSFKMPSAGAGPGASGVEVTDVQRSIFNAPAPGSAPAAGSTTSAAPTSSLPPKPAAPLRAEADTASKGRGQKRPREEAEEEEDSDSDVAMEEDSDDDD
ncbi:uncharacterized protein MKZ38_006363 [Zalerion maritima]|uniref:RRM domain-containing protein n=1 Tax=Zalerion maritima TaxID=339359 RepID=A0AAD5WWW1_9PEZI|nr:uncharacterized protein MKZ38_006363 [Zalerion maritima]